MENVMTESLKAFILADKLTTSTLISGGVRDTYAELPTSKPGEEQQPILGVIQGVMNRDEKDAPEALTAVLPNCKKVVNYSIPVSVKDKVYQVGIPANALGLFENVQIGDTINFVKTEGESKAKRKYALLNFLSVANVAESAPKG